MHNIKNRQVELKTQTQDLAQQAQGSLTTNPAKPLIAEQALSLIEHMQQNGENPDYHQKLRLGLIDSINVALVHIFTIHATGHNASTQSVPYSVIEYTATEEPFSIRLYPYAAIPGTQGNGLTPYNLELTEALDDFTEKIADVLDRMEDEDEEGMGLDVSSMADAPTYEPVGVSRGLNNVLKLDFDDALQAIAFLEALSERLDIGNMDYTPEAQEEEAPSSLDEPHRTPDHEDLQFIPAGIYATPHEAFARSIRAQADPRAIPESLDRMMAIAMEIEGISAEMPSAYNLQ